MSEQVHLKTQVREAIAEALADLTDANGRTIPVYQSRLYQVSPDELPCIFVHTTDDDSTVAAGHLQGRRVINRAFGLKIIAMFGGAVVEGNSLEDDSERLTGEIEDRLNKRFALVGNAAPLVKRINLTKVTAGWLAGSKSIVAAAMSWTAVVNHIEGDPFNAL